MTILFNRKILIVEDELPLLKILTEKLSGEGFSVVGAKDGKEGLELALKEIPDLILLDIVMPSMDGMEMLRRLRNSPTGKKIPVIILSNLGETSTILEAKELNIKGYLIKSNIKLEDVLKLVREKLKF
ncbi:MAG: response regulator [Candidatus Daviesbacteria bacterium]|nr:response regulator [Candidatus Daviesbacteria bacterium]